MLSNMSDKGPRAHRRNNSSAFEKAANNTMDLTAYRGNLYKQTLSPNWSKTRLREARDKYNKITDEARASLDGSGLERRGNHSIDATKRDAFLDTTISSVPTWRRTN